MFQPAHFDQEEKEVEKEVEKQDHNNLLQESQFASASKANE
jgi:hypothetical protein